jgi:hypothetical protein
MRPSAHAACPRTSGSSSFSAMASAGTASGAPQLPSATATLRSRPRRLARLIGEPLKRALNSSCVNTPPRRKQSAAPGVYLGGYRYKGGKSLQRRDLASEPRRDGIRIH